MAGLHSLLPTHDVITAQAGIHVRGAPYHLAPGWFPAWISASAGMTL